MTPRLPPTRGEVTPRSLRRASLALPLILALPPLRHALDAGMVTQMLVQMPLLGVAGWLAAAALPASARARVDGFNRYGITGLALAMVTSACWMLPRALDAAAADPLVASLKYASVPLLVGAPLALSWPRMSFVVRGVFLAEVVASLFRLGWLYRVSPLRLCSRYPLEDQQRLGLYLLALGAAASAAIAWKLLFGHFDTRSARARGAAGYDDARAPQAAI